MFFLDNLMRNIRNIGNNSNFAMFNRPIKFSRNTSHIGSINRNTNENISGYGSRSSNTSLKNFMKNDHSRCLYKLVTKEHAAQLIKSDNVVLIDVRTRREYEAVHIQNAINIPVEEMEETLKNVNLDKTKNIMVYCSTGTRNKAAIQILNKLGYGEVLIWEYGALATFPYKDMLVYAK
jgi:rhodanese-related sulfurtransferase